MFLEKLVRLQKNNTFHVQVSSSLCLFFFFNIYLFIWLCQALTA